MTDFETSAAVTVSLEERSLREARSDLEGELTADPITIGVASGGGGARADGGRGMGAVADATDTLVTLADDRNTILGEILEAMDAQAFESAQAGGGGGGGGGPLPIPTNLLGGPGSLGALGTAGVLASGGLSQGLAALTGDKQRESLNNALPGVGGDAVEGAMRLTKMSGLLGPGFQFDAWQQTIEDAQNFEWPEPPAIPEFQWPGPPALPEFQWPEPPALPEFQWPKPPDPLDLSTEDWPQAPDPLAGLTADNWPSPPDPFAELTRQDWPQAPDPLSGIEWPEPPDPFEGLQWPDAPDLDLAVDVDLPNLAREVQQIVEDYLRTEAGLEF